MIPFILTPTELPHTLSLKPGETFLIMRPVEPQPVHQLRNEFSTVQTVETLEPFGKVGDEFFVQAIQGLAISEKIINRTFKHVGTEVSRTMEIMPAQAYDLGYNINTDPDNYMQWVHEYWNSCYGKDYPWESNPWIFIGKMEVMK